MRDTWEKIAKTRGHKTLRSLLIQKYVLEGRSSGWIAVYIGASRWTIINLLRAEGIPLRGNKTHFTSNAERQKWEVEVER
jgi:hypothetical protein